MFFPYSASDNKTLEKHVMKPELRINFPNPISGFVEQAVLWAEAAVDAVTTDEETARPDGASSDVIKLSAGIELPVALLQLPAQQILPMYGLMRDMIAPAYIMQAVGYIEAYANDLISDDDSIEELASGLNALTKEDIKELLSGFTSGRNLEQVALVKAQTFGVYKKLIEKFSVETMVEKTLELAQKLPPRTRAAMFAAFGSEEDYGQYLTDMFSYVEQTDLAEIVAATQSIDQDALNDATATSLYEVYQKVDAGKIKSLVTAFSHATQEGIAVTAQQVLIAGGEVLETVAAGGFSGIGKSLAAPFDAVSAIIGDAAATLEEVIVDDLDLAPDTNPYPAYVNAIRTAYNI
jgi:hypothetical protein